jgi:hypothetical protein
MNLESLFAKVMGRHWPWFMEMHLYYFSERTLRCLLERAKFQWKVSKPQGRYLQLGYLVSRLKAYSPRLMYILQKGIHGLHLERVPVAVNLGDLITVYAQKPD